MYSEYLFCKGVSFFIFFLFFLLVMIKIKIDDTIVDIVEKIESQKHWDIILDFPLGHPILHNYISLKILKSKAQNKKLIIATNDRIGKKIGKQLGIEYSSVKDSTFIEKWSKNTILQHNFTFWEYFKFQIRSYIRELRFFLSTNKKLNSLSRYSHVYQEKTSLHIFLWLLIFSLLLFIFIYYFAINKSYIYISPEIIVKKEAHNFIFKKNKENSILWNNKNIKIDVLSEKIDLNETYASTDIKSNKHDVSSWKVVLYNLFQEEQTLVPNTRLQASNGVVFEIPDWVKIPAALQDNFWKVSPGSIEVTVQAKLKDSMWEYTWSRWNIWASSHLYLPGLSEENQKLIYAKSIEKFSWWRDDFQKMIAKEDIENAKKLFSQKLKTEALKSLKNNILIHNNRNNSQIDILSWEETISYKDMIINIPAWVEPWALKNSFSLTGSIVVHAYTYDKEGIIQKLKTLINEKKLEWVEKISHIDTNSLRMSEILYSDKSPFEMKATFEIETLFFHDFLHKENTYISTLRSKVRGVSKDEAEKILLNDPKISNVEIKIRPFFVNTISNIHNNIIFELQK